MSKNIGRVKPVDITEEVKASYLDYAMSVIVARALPDVRDGLKPVHRRIFYAMHGLGLTHKAKYTKSAKIVGDCMGKYHPHGDLALYDALARLAQDFAMRYPLIDGQGNFGSIDGDSPAAMRYTEARLSAIAQELLADLDKETVDFRDNFDSSLKEPVFLPAKIPNLLLMGSDGIAVGMATKIPPHNLNEVVDALVFMIEKGVVVEPQLEIKKIDLDEEDLGTTALRMSFASEVIIEDLIHFIKGPDFPTGATIYNKQDIIQAYSTGRGKVIMQAKAKIEETKGGKFQIVINEIPYQVNKARLVEKIARLVKDKKINGIADLRDESDRHGLQVVIELKKTAKPKAILNNLYKHTPMRTSYPFNMVALVNGVPRTLNLKQILTEFIKHRQQVVVKRTVFELQEAKRRAHILEGLKIALDNLDAVITTIRKSATVDTARTNLMKKFELTEIQANAILEMQLRRLAALERKKIEDEYKELGKKIEHLTDLLVTPKKILNLIKKELVELKKNYGDERRTKVYNQPLGEFREEDLVPKEKCLVILTKGGYIKRLPVDTYRSQRRGGKGVTGMRTKETDEISRFFTTNTHDNILFFTNKGRVFATKVWDIPEGLRQAKGSAVINLINIDQDEIIQSVLATASEQKKHHLLMATKKGVVKKTNIKKFANIRSSGLIAIKLDKQDKLCWVKQTTGQDHVLLVTRHGKSIRFKEANVRPMGRDTRGVRGIKLKKDDYVVTMEAFPARQVRPKDRRRKFFRDVLVVMKNGLGKRTKLTQYPLQKRGGIGVKVANVTQKSGKVVTCQLVNHEIKQIILTSKKAQVIKLPLKNIPRLGRDTQGVILMRFSKSDDKVAAVTCLKK
ncbi:MAG TPA: DNA gyrase subunit A [Nevskiaceae bacterium]|nr:DNA gyrase subunit A [Nevskiaceae bacterium]